MSKKQYEPSNFFLVDVKQNGADLVELAGVCTGYIYTERRLPDHCVRDIEAAARKILASVERYRTATAQSRESLTRPEYEKA